MFFHTGPDQSRRQNATAHTLNSMGSALLYLRPTDVLALWSQLKDKDYVWQQAIEAFGQRYEPEQAMRLRTAAVFWAGGVTPTVELPAALVSFFERTTFAFVLMRQVKDRQIYLDRETPRRIGFGLHFLAIALRHDGVIRVQPADRDALIESMAEALYIVRLCREGFVLSVDQLGRYLRELGLFPRDLGVTNRELYGWIHRKLVEQARGKLSACYDAKGECDPLQAHVNVYGGLSALNLGVSLDEAGVTADQLRDIREALKSWLPEAYANPSHYCTSEDSLRAFERTVFTLFNQVLDDASHSDVVR